MAIRWLILVFSFLLFSCGGSEKLRPTENAKKTHKILKQKERAHKKKLKKARKNKRKTGYYSGMRSFDVNR